MLRYTAIINNSLDHNTSWKTNSSLVSQEIHRILWNLKLQYHVHKSLPLVLILSQTNPVHAISSCLLEINSNMTLPYKLRFSKQPYSFRFPHQNPVSISVFHNATCLLQLIHLDFRIQLIVVRSINHEAPHIFHPPRMSPNLCPNISFSTLFFNSFSLCFYPIMCQTHFHTHTKLATLQFCIWYITKSVMRKNYKVLDWWKNEEFEYIHFLL